MTLTGNNVLAIDQGTFSSRCLLFNALGEEIDRSQCSLHLNRINDHEIEQDADELLNSVQQSVEEILHNDKNIVSRITTAGLATQRSSILAWRPSNGQAISPVLSWQDTRGFEWLESFKPRKMSIQSKTGLRLSAHYGVSKMSWLLNNDAQVIQAMRQDDCVITPVASYILYHLCKNRPIKIDGANASRTLLYNFKQQYWDEDLVRLFAINKKILPRCETTASDYGIIKNSNIPITAVNGDQTAALYSNGMPSSKSLRVNLGTGAFVLTPIDAALIDSRQFKKSGLLAGVSFSDDQSTHYYIEGTVNGAGSAIEWLKQQSPDVKYETFVIDQERMQRDILFINAVGGMGSPIWSHDIEPHFINDQQANAKDRLFAVLESIVFLLQINIEQIRHIKTGLSEIEISGGLSNNEYICQCLANLAQLKVIKKEETEATARGIAWQALAKKEQWKKAQIIREYCVNKDNQLENRYQNFKTYINLG